MKRSAPKKSASSTSASHQTLEQYLATQPTIYIVAENLHPRDLSRTKGEEGYRILGAFSTVDTANEYARKYAYGLKKWDESPKGAKWAEEDLQLTGNVDGIKQRTDAIDGTDEYDVVWSHFTTVKVARWSVRDVAPTVNSNTEFFDRVDFEVDAGVDESIYGESDGEDSDDDDEHDLKMGNIKDELEGLTMDRKKDVEEVIGSGYREL